MGDEVAVHGDNHSLVVSHSSEPAKFLLAKNRMGHEDFVGPRDRHRLRFADFGHRETDRAALHLHARHFDRLVRLGVGSEAYTVALQEIGGTIQIAFDDIEVDDDCGR